MQEGVRILVVAGSLAITVGCKNHAGGSGAPAGLAMSASAAPVNVCPDADPKRCFDRAWKLYMGVGRPEPDREAAMALHEAACERSLGEACNALGEIYFFGEVGIEPNIEKAVAMLEKACTDGHASACLGLGNLRSTGSGKLDKDQEKARALYERAMALEAKACDGGDAIACASVAVQCERGLGATPADKPRAARMFEKAASAAAASCEKADAEACNQLGFLYDHGKGGLPVDKTKARAFLEKACGAGNGTACTNLGRYAENGFGGLEKSASKAVEFFAKACDEGNGEGCYLAGLAHAEQGPTQDLASAVLFYRRGCDRREGAACTNLGVRVERGEGNTPVDKEKAVALYTLACNLGSSVGCKNRNILGELVALDKDAAEFRKALKTGSESHCGLVIDVKPPIAKVQAMIGEAWLKIDQLYPKGKQSRRWANGVYQDPT